MEYNINNYTDQECFTMLELDNPTDRVLEMKILQFMDKYEEKSKRLYQFFESMYDRFFLDGSDENESEDEREDAVEGFEYDMKIVQANDNSKLNEQAKDPKLDAIAKQLIINRDKQNALIPRKANKKFDEKTVAAGDPNAKEQAIKKIGESTTTISTVATHNIDYIADPRKLNPVERKTIFKMISIDSQFREDPGNTSATNFTMNLSESIDNVISMKLYSVQIPYTWYTINETFGSNFFYIKGNSPGINNGDHDIKVEIGSGTYDGNGIVNAVNNQFSFLKGVRNDSEIKYNSIYSSVVDLSFGETKMSYELGAKNSKIVFEFDLKKKYNETDYQLYFPTWSTPNVIGTDKSLTIPSFLGFNYTNYYPYVAYSQRNILPLIGDTLSANQSSYTINRRPNDLSNNYFTIYEYLGTDQFDISTSTIINRIPIILTLPNNTYNRNTIEANVKLQMAANKYLDQTWSYFNRVNNTSRDLSNSHYEIAIKLNRAEISQTDNSKLAIVFPDETTINGKHIWTGADSCFVFKNVNTIELNEVVSETETLLTNYIIDLSAALIQIECIKPNYNVIENTRIATVPASSTNGFPNGYLFTSYFDAVINALITMNDATIDPIYKPNGEFNINVGSSTYNTGLTISQDKARFQFDIAREFTQEAYIVDLSSCFLSQAPFFYDASYNNLTNSNFTLIRDFSSAPSITINSSNNKIVLIPKKTGGPNGNGYGNQNSPNVELFFTQANYGALDNLIRGINNDFIRFVDSDGYPIMNASNIFFSNSKLTLQFKINKILSEINYKVSFIDNSSRNSWNNYLFMDFSYNLANNMSTTLTHAEVFGRSPVFNNTITLDSRNNEFIFKPYFNGVADPGGANDIIFSVPLTVSNNSTLPTVYTREGLINAIQTLFDANDLTNGSKIKLVDDGNFQYANIRMNVNKTYYSSDFKLVFYDSVSFVYCNVGVTQNATWDSTLGWLLGFHSFTEYNLVDFTKITSAYLSTENYKNNVFDSKTYKYSYSYNSTSKKIAVIGDVVLNTNLYNYFLVVLDDFIQNHVNSGLITITSLENDIALPSYASRVSYQCDPATGIRTAVSATNKLNTELSSKQLYAMNQIIENKRTKSKSYASGPYMKDVFALIPMKLTGMQFGQTYMEFGGTMQNQDRKYYGPVRIQKFAIKLMNDKGQTVDLNGANFSICLICEILNTSTK
jgi:hypothetical protein